MEFDLVVNLESWADGEVRPRRSLRLDAKVEERKLTGWNVDGPTETPSSSAASSASTTDNENAKVALLRNFEFRLPLTWLLATPGSNLKNFAARGNQFAGAAAVPSTSRLKLRFSLWQNRLPVDALPVEGWIELHLLSEGELDSAM
jgi:hypothetical protein